MSKLNFTFIYTFNYVNSQRPFFDCADLNEGALMAIRVISQIIGYSSELAPFTQCLLLIVVIQFIGQAEQMEEGEDGEQDFFDEDDKNS